MTYQAILFHPDGDFVTDFSGCETKAEVWEKVNDMGSRWIFYPLVFIRTEEGRRIVDTPSGMGFLIGRKTSTVKKYLAGNWAQNSEEICRAINEGAWPLDSVYQDTF
jgi:hypothetical protein